MHITNTLKAKPLPLWLIWVALAFFVLGVIVVGLVRHNTHSLSSETETNETGSVIKPENPLGKI